MNLSLSSALLLLLSSNAHVALASGTLRGRGGSQSIEKERATPTQSTQGVPRLEVEAEMKELESEVNDRDLKADNAELKSSIEAIEETLQGTAMAPVSVNEPGDDEEHQWPLLEDVEAQEVPFDDADADVEHGHGRERELGGSDCGIWADGYYFHPKAGKCYDLGGTWWDDKVTWIRASSGTCVKTWEHHWGGSYKKHCGSDWLKLGSSLSKKVSRVCCPARKHI